VLSDFSETLGGMSCKACSKSVGNVKAKECLQARLASIARERGPCVSFCRLEPAQPATAVDAREPAWTIVKPASEPVGSGHGVWSPIRKMGGPADGYACESSLSFEITHLVSKQGQRNATAIWLTLRQRLGHVQRLFGGNACRHGRLERIDYRFNNGWPS